MTDIVKSNPVYSMGVNGGGGGLAAPIPQQPSVGKVAVAFAMSSPLVMMVKFLFLFIFLLSPFLPLLLYTLTLQCIPHLSQKPPSPLPQFTCIPTLSSFFFSLC